MMGEVLSPSWLHESLETSVIPRKIESRGCKVHGYSSIPAGYELAYVPSDAKVTIRHNLVDQDRENFSGTPIQVSFSYSLTKAVAGLGQTLYAALTLYRTRGDQIEEFGYAAFGLTVIPYFIMSILNLMAQVATPEFPAFYLVHSKEMDEARSDLGRYLMESLDRPCRRRLEKSQLGHGWSIMSWTIDLVRK
jgi:hypothetical protein